MNIIIIGSGTVGTEICSLLAKDGHAITVIDNDQESVNSVSNICDVTGIFGNGADISVLREAGAERADLLIAVTKSDELNILCCYAAKKLGTHYTIGRVRNPEYRGLMEILKDDVSLSLTINPELCAAEEISRIIRFPSASRVDAFCSGLVEIAEITVPENSSICKKSLYSLREELGIKFIVCSVLRGGDVYIPSGDFVLEGGDLICVTASNKELTKFLKAVGNYKKPSKNILITGGGRTTYYLGKLIDRKASVTVIEKNSEICREISEAYDWTVINENPANQDVLLEEGLERVDAMLSLTDFDEENAITSMFAKTKKVPTIFTMIRSLPYVDFFKSAGIERIVSPKTATVNHILKFIRSVDASHDSEIESLQRLLGGKTEAVEFLVKEHIGNVTGVALKNLKRKPNTIIACIVRGGEVIIPGGEDVIMPSDRVIVITKNRQMNDIKDIKS